MSKVVVRRMGFDILEVETYGTFANGDLLNYRFRLSDVDRTWDICLMTTSVYSTCTIKDMFGVDSPYICISKYLDEDEDEGVHKENRYRTFKKGEFDETLKQIVREFGVMGDFAVEAA